MMDKIVLQSSRALPSCDNYAIGIYQDGEFHLTPLKGIIQMRPQFNYLDRIDKKGKDDGKNDGEGEINFHIFYFVLLVLVLLTFDYDC